MSIAMRMPAVVHPPVELSAPIDSTTQRRRSRWHRLGWTGFQALGFLVLLVVLAVVGPAVWPWGALGPSAFWATACAMLPIPVRVEPASHADSS